MSLREIRFHHFHGKDVTLSNGNTRARRTGCGYTSDYTRFGVEHPTDLGTEAVFSNMPIEVTDRVGLRFGAPIDRYYGTPCRINTTVTVGITVNNPNRMSEESINRQLRELPGYWMSKQPIENETRLHLSVSPSGEILFSDRERTCTGPRVNYINKTLWVVVVVPRYDIYVEFDPDASRQYLGAFRKRLKSLPQFEVTQTLLPVSSSDRSSVPVNSPQQDGLLESQSGTSIPSSSSQDPSTTHQSDHGDTGERENTTRGERQDPTSPECIICYNKPPDTALSPCGHMHTCHDCALDLWQGRGRGLCPSCRKEITSVLRVFRD